MSAQNRKRLYWTNIPNIEQPEDKGILLKDILLTGVVDEKKSATIKEQYYKSSKANFERSGSFHATGVKNSNKIDLTDEELKNLAANPDSRVIPENQPTDVIDAYNRKCVKDDKSTTLRTNNNTGNIWVSLNDNQLKKLNNINTQDDKMGCLTEATVARGGSSYEYLAMLKRIASVEQELDDLILSPSEWDLVIKESDTKTNSGIITHEIQKKVKVRKHEVYVPKLQKVLKEYKEKSKLTIKEISEKLNVQKTKVEHWFRTDIYFAIPDPDVWFQLKELFNITMLDFDASITEFVVKDGVFDMSNRIYDSKGKAPTLLSSKTEYPIIDGEYQSKPSTDKDSLCKQVGMADLNGHDFLKRVYSPDGKSPTLTAVSGGNQERKVAVDKKMWRKLHPIECERLQTVPDGYTEFGLNENGETIKISNTQRYKMLGNGWTTDVITHMLQNMFTTAKPTGLEEFIDF